MSEDGPVSLTEDQIQSILEVRRQRSAILGDGLFSDPAWDILLELLAARLGKRKLTLSDLENIAPPSVVARWVATLQERALVVCETNAFRPDQFGIELSEECSHRLMRFFKTARHIRGFA